MVTRYPTADFQANSPAKFTIQWRGKRGCKRFEVSTPTLIFLAIPLAALLVWYLVASFYFVFRDDMLAKLLSNQAEAQYSYEDRIASLRMHLDRVATKQLVSQDSFEDRVNELIARQSQLETRQAIVSALISDAQKQAPRSSVPAPKSQIPLGQLPVIHHGFMPTSPAPLVRPPSPVPSHLGGPFVSMPPLPPSKPLVSVPTSDISGLRLTSDSAAPNALAQDGLPKDGLPKFAGALIGGRFQWANTIDNGLKRIEQNQVVALATLENSTQVKINQMRSALSEIGLSTKRFSTHKFTNDDGVGGPLESISKLSQNDSFDRAVVRLIGSLKESVRASTVLQAIPLARPLSGEQIVSSNFGARSDPFLHNAAMHTGLDFKSPYGNPVFSASAGRVIGASSQGGYGNMVEIDHGYGITTRYAHLSSILVDVGDTVTKGEKVGLVGSTGRSTGPHLHYETRIDGEATDPMRFLQAATRLGIN